MARTSSDASISSGDRTLLQKAKSPDVVHTIKSVDIEKVERELEHDDWLFHEGNVEELANSPYPEVRAAVSLDIDLDVKLNHWRTWTLTMIFVIVFAGVNQFFFSPVSVIDNWVYCGPDCIFSHWQAVGQAPKLQTFLPSRFLPVESRTVLKTRAWLANDCGVVNLVYFIRHEHFNCPDQFL